MFKTIANTWALTGLSWKVLQKNRSLLWLPLISGAALIALILATTGVFAAAGAFGSEDSAGYYIYGAVAYFIATFVIIYFNSALVVAAFEHLNGGTPTIHSAIARTNEHLPSILGWAAFSTTIGLLLENLRNGDGIVFKVVGWILSAIWAYMTYFVVPVLVIEGLSPFDAVKRSSQLLKQTWGNQATANFGFGLIYIVLIVVAVVPAAVAFSSSDALGIAVAVLVSVPVLAGGLCVLFAMEGIFRAALYQYATTGKSAAFPDAVLGRAFVAKEDRGDFDNNRWYRQP